LRVEAMNTCTGFGFWGTLAEANGSIAPISVPHMTQPTRLAATVRPTMTK